MTHKHSHTAGSREASLSRGNEKEKTLKQACFQGYPESAVYVQIPIGSRNSAIHNAYHTSLRPSSLFEPRHPSLKVVRQMEWREPLEKIQVSTNVKFKRHRQRSERGYDGPLSPHTLPASPCTGVSTLSLHPHPGPHRGSFTWFGWMRANDPSAGSPTETLLRLLLPLSDKVH